MGNNDLEKMPIPEYSKKQAAANVMSHLVGAGVSCGMFIGLLFTMINKHNSKPLDYFAIIVYCLVLTGQFIISSVYHYDKSRGKTKQIKRLFDHLTIFALIAATYFPICLIGLRNTIEGTAILISVLSMMVIGIALNIWHMDKLVVRIITLVFYVLMGWIIIFVPSAWGRLPQLSFIFILVGGVVFTVGSVLYAVGHLKSQWFHVVFHILIVIGAIFQAVGIFYLIS